MHSRLSLTSFSEGSEEVQCVGFRSISLWTIAEREYNVLSMFSIMYNHLKIRTILFSLLLNDTETNIYIYIQAVGSLSQSLQVAPPCFYSSPECTNQTQALERALFAFFASFMATVGFPCTWKGRVAGETFIWNLQLHYCRCC